MLESWILETQKESRRKHLDFNRFYFKKNLITMQLKVGIVCWNTLWWNHVKLWNPVLCNFIDLLSQLLPTMFQYQVKQCWRHLLCQGPRCFPRVAASEVNATNMEGQMVTADLKFLSLDKKLIEGDLIKKSGKFETTNRDSFSKKNMM